MDQISSIEKYFSNHALIKVVKTFSDGLNAFNYIKSKYDDFDTIIKVVEQSKFLI